MQHVSE